MRHHDSHGAALLPLPAGYDLAEASAVGGHQLRNGHGVPFLALVDRVAGQPCEMQGLRLCLK